PYLAAGCTRRGPDGRIDRPRGGLAEGGWLRFPALRAAALPAGRPGLAAGPHRSLGHRDPLRRDRLCRAEGSEEAGGVFVGGAYGLRHARDLRSEPAGWRRRRAADAQPRFRHRCALPLRRNPVRKDASPDDRGPRRPGEHVASVHDLFRRVRSRVAWVAWPQWLRRRVPGAPWDVRVLGRAASRWALLGTARGHRRDPRGRLSALDVPTRHVRAGA